MEAFATSDIDLEIDFADLAEIDLPFMDEPIPPMQRQYTKPHTIAWSERVDAADAFIFVTPKYNHSYSPVLKNAMDFLTHEWANKPVGFVSYGASAAGARGVTALEPVLVALGMRKVSSSVEVSAVWTRVVDNTFLAEEHEVDALTAQIAQLRSYSDIYASVR